MHWPTNLKKWQRIFLNANSFWPNVQAFAGYVKLLIQNLFKYSFLRSHRTYFCSPGSADKNDIKKS